jgi:DNA-binding transcriptional MocR family regulator
MTLHWTPQLGAGGPLYVEIARAIEADVLSGRLRPGDRLPPHRELADRIGVTVGTVSRGYAEAQKAGWISGEVGRGTFVLARQASVPGPGKDPELVDLSLNLPVDSPIPDLDLALRALAADGGLEAALCYSLRGTRKDREAGAAVLQRHGLGVDPEAVILCSGAQHGVGVILETIARPGDCILAESLTYPAFRSLAQARGLRLLPVALDEEGLLPDALDAACRAHRPKALYTIPTLHNPTCSTLSLERRHALVDLARRHDLLVIEDDLYRMLEPTAPAPIASLAPERTLYVTSLSKSFAPGLRVGYLTGPPSLGPRLEEAVWHSVLTPSSLTVALATRWILCGQFDTIAAAKREEARARQALAAQILPEVLVQTAPTAYHLWLSTGASSAEAFALEAQARGVIVAPGTAFHLGPGSPPAAVRVSLSAARDRAELTAALERLRDLLVGSRRMAGPRL